MSITFFRSFALMVAAVISMAAAAVADVTSVQMYYDPATGNIKLQNTTSGTLQIQSFDILTLGNGTQGTATSGSTGYLSQAAAALPAAALSISNTSASGVNGLYSQAYAANFGTALFTLQPYGGWSAEAPIGPAGSFFDLGNIAALGMTQSDLDVRFLTDFESTPPDFDTSAYGQFLYTFRVGSSGDFSGNTLGNAVAVPEPSTVALLGVAACVGGLALRRRKTGAGGRT